MKAGLEIYFLASPNIFKNLSLVREPKKAIFMGAKWHCFVIHITWHGISSENLEKKSSVQNETPLWSGQARSGQVRSCEVILIWEDTYSIQRVKQKLPTKFHVNQAIEPGIITVDTQIASGHLIILAIYLHIETGISKFFKMSAILSGHSMVMFHPWSAPNTVDFRAGKSINPRTGMGFRITRPGRGAESALPPANSAPMKARIPIFMGSGMAKDLYHV